MEAEKLFLAEIGGEVARTFWRSNILQLGKRLATVKTEEADNKTAALLAVLKIKKT